MSKQTSTQTGLGFWGLTSNSLNNIKDIRVYKSSLVVSSFTLHYKCGTTDYHFDSFIYFI